LFFEAAGIKLYHGALDFIPKLYLRAAGIDEWDNLDVGFFFLVKLFFFFLYFVIIFKTQTRSSFSYHIIIICTYVVMAYRIERCAATAVTTWRANARKAIITIIKSSRVCRCQRLRNVGFRTQTDTTLNLPFFPPLCPTPPPRPHTLENRTLTHGRNWKTYRNRII
jgi:hypothetical protein